MKGNSEKIAVILKTLPGRISIESVLTSVRWSLQGHEYRIYLGDSIPLDPWKEDLYEELQRKGHHVDVWTEDIPPTRARNMLVRKLQNENRVLRLDDDFELGGEFKIGALLAVLKGRPEIAFCSDMERQLGDGKGAPSGTMRQQGGQLQLHGDGPVITWRANEDWDFSFVNGVRYAKIDYTRNLLLLRRECFETVQWDEGFGFVGEHADFLLALKQRGYQGAFTPDSVHYHRHDLKVLAVKPSLDEKARKDEWDTVAEERFKKKWGSARLRHERKSNTVGRLRRIVNSLRR